VATVVVNTPDHVEFKNLAVGQKPESVPTLLVQAGIWEAKNGSKENGVIFDVTGAELPLLTAADARKLSRWLARAADTLDGGRKKSDKSRRHYDTDDEPY
jgi:hypothetical protein